MKQNLNCCLIPSVEGEDEKLLDFSMKYGEVEIFFRDISYHLANYISKYEVIVGCVAWMTHQIVLDPLINKPNVSIIVQKEDFLKPDINQRNNWKQRLHAAYNLIGGRLCRPQFPLAYDMSYCGDPTIEGVRCVGNYNRNKASSPRMHNKFIIFCDMEENKDSYGYTFVIPKIVWTGSFNFSDCATKSFENAVVIHNQEIACAYLNEYSQILALSEPLDWEHEWVAPEWRIGS